MPIVWSSSEDPAVIASSLDELGYNSITSDLLPDELFQQSNELSALFADSDSTCVSSEDRIQLSIGKRARKRGVICPLDKDTGPPAVEQQSPPTTEPTLPPIEFPSPNSNQDRMNGKTPLLDLNPRPLRMIQNTDFDYKYCSAGVNGYQLYAVCDSGFDTDRIPNFGFYSLYHVEPCR